METTFPTAAQQVGRTLSTTIIDPLVDAFNNFFDSPFAMSVPKANVAEKDNEIQIDLAVPGLQKEDFTIRADGNMLTVSAQKESSNTENDDPKTTVGNIITPRSRARSCCPIRLKSIRQRRPIKTVF